MLITDISAIVAWAPSSSRRPPLGLSGLVGPVENSILGAKKSKNAFFSLKKVEIPKKAQAGPGLHDTV